MSCQSQQKNNMNQDKVNFYPNDLVYIKSIPTSDDVYPVPVTFKRSIGSSKTLLSKILLRQILSHNKTRILDPNTKLDAELLADWSYSPWYTIEFTTVKGNYKISLFLGGLGFMTLPNGKRGAVLFDLSDLKKEEDEKLLKYYKKIKRKALSTRTKDEDVKEIYLATNVSYILDDDAIKINNHYPHPSKEFSENMDIHQYVVKDDYGKISFWKRDTQILETDNYYPKMVADFINTGERLTMQQGTYNTTMRLMEDNVLVFPDGLKINLAYFSHKKTFQNQRSPAIAHLELSDKHSESNWFTIRRSEDKDEQGKFITSYESKKWKDYNIELTGLAYDEYIDIVVSKKAFLEITNELAVAEFEQIKNFILKNKGRQTYRTFDGNNPHFAFIDFDLYLGADVWKTNMDNDPDISDFNELVIRVNHHAAPMNYGTINYYAIIIVRKGDVDRGKPRILEGMKEDKVYLVDLDEVGLDKLQKQLPSFLKTIRERMNDSK